MSFVVLRFQTGIIVHDSIPHVLVCSALEKTLDCRLWSYLSVLSDEKAHNGIVNT